MTVKETPAYPDYDPLPHSHVVRLQQRVDALKFVAEGKHYPRINAVIEKAFPQQHYLLGEAGDPSQAAGFERE